MRRTFCGGVRLLLAAVLLGTLTLTGALLPPAVAAQTVEQETHALVLTSLVSAWNAGDARRVMRHFATGAVVGDDWSAFSGAGLTSWVEEHARNGVLLTAQVETADGRRATWRVAFNSAVDRRLGLPLLERWADVELRDGAIMSMTFRSDPVSRERYSRAVEAVAAQLLPNRTSAPAEPAGSSTVRAPGRAVPADTSAWIAAAVVLTLVAGAAARR